MSFDDAKTVVYVNCMIVIIAIDLEGTDYADLKPVVKERIQHANTFLSEPNITIKWKTKTTILSGQFQNLTKKSYKQSDKVYTPNTHIHVCHRSLSWLGAGTSIKSN